MSGKPKGPALSPAEEMRELTRAANGAVKDLRAAIREAREESFRLRGEHAAALDETLRLAAATAAEGLDNALEIALRHVEKEVGAVQDHLANVIGSQTSAELAQTLMDHAAAELARMLRPELKLPAGTTVGLAVRDNPKPRPPRPPGRVFVTTDPALAPPGSVVIDGR